MIPLLELLEEGWVNTEHNFVYIDSRKQRHEYLILRKADTTTSMIYDPETKNIITVFDCEYHNGGS